MQIKPGREQLTACCLKRVKSKVEGSFLGLEASQEDQRILTVVAAQLLRFANREV